LSGVEVVALSKTFGALRVLDRVSARFAGGKFTSLLGPSGSGKTTLLRVVAGFVAADEGEVRIDGAEVTRVPVWRRRIGMVFQSYALFPHMSVMENVAFGLHRRGVRGEEARREVARALDLVRLAGLEDRRPKQLSGGQQQRVALARAIVTNPKVLLLDEPLSALDRRLRQEMEVELKRIQRESGLTTIFVTHDQEEALTLSDRVAILDGGRIVQEGAPAEVYERPRTRFAASFLGDANFLEGRVTDGAVAAAGGSVRSTDPLPTGGALATVAVRPEKISIIPAGAASTSGLENRMPARIREIIYAGAASTYLLDGPGGETWTVFSQNRESFPAAIGEEVVLAWSADHTIVIQGQ
jgi:putative spermidine/putrescine transport system ATP-binding protein/spermidine/putrescine transport system ATP-binding protein